MEMPNLPVLLASSRGGALVVAGPILAIILFNVGAGGHSSIQRLLRSVFFGLLAGLAATFILTRADEDMPRIAAVFLAAFLLAAAVQWGLFGFARSTVERREKEGRKDVGSLWIAVAPQVMALLGSWFRPTFSGMSGGGGGPLSLPKPPSGFGGAFDVHRRGDRSWAYVLWWAMCYGKVLGKTDCAGAVVAGGGGGRRFGRRTSLHQSEIARWFRQSPLRTHAAGG
jgi:hypothetical protein